MPPGLSSGTLISCPILWLPPPDLPARTTAAAAPSRAEQKKQHTEQSRNRNRNSNRNRNRAEQSLSTAVTYMSFASLFCLSHISISSTELRHRYSIAPDVTVLFFASGILLVFFLALALGLRIDCSALPPRSTRQSKVAHFYKY